MANSKLDIKGRQAIAHFRSVKTFFYSILIITVIVAALYEVALHPYGLDFGPRVNLGPAYILLELILIPPVLWLLVIALMYVRQIVGDGSLALWVEGADLIFVNKRVYKLALAEITGVHTGVIAGSRLKQKGIVIERKDGSRRIPIGILREPATTIIDGINAAIAARRDL